MKVELKKNLDVTCIGAALVDMVARVQRHPEEDDEVFVSNLEILSGGAAANTAHACSRLGLKTAFIGKLGEDDEFGSKILNDFKRVNMDLSLIKYSTKHGTGSAYVALNKRGDRRIYAHSGAANHLSAEDIKSKEITRTRITYLSSLKNLAPFIEAARISRQNDIPVILNPGMLIIDQGLTEITPLLKEVDVLILSQREFLTLLDLRKDELKPQIIQAITQKLFDLGLKVIIITMGAKGALLFDGERTELVPTSKVKEVVDTTGAGDAFSAGFIRGFSQDLSYEFEPLRRNVKAGNFVAGKCVQVLGARNGLPTKKEMDENLPLL